MQIAKCEMRFAKCELLNANHESRETTTLTQQISTMPLVVLLFTCILFVYVMPDPPIPCDTLNSLVLKGYTVAEIAVELGLKHNNWRR